MGTSITRDFNKEILSSLNNNSFGLTITEIANNINTTRNTVYRHIILLEGQYLVFKKKVGNYVLYFSKEKEMKFSNNLIPLYKDFICCLKEQFPDSENKFKEIGKKLEPKNVLLALKEGFKHLNTIEQLTGKNLFEEIRKIIPFLNLFDDNINVKIIDLNEQKTKATYLITNSVMLKYDKSHYYHLFILSGFLEVNLSKILKKNIHIEFLGSEFFENPNNNYFKFSIEIG